MKSDINEPPFEPLFRPDKKPGVGKTRRIVGWLLFFVVLAVFCLVLVRRLSTGFTRYKIIDEESGLTADNDSTLKKHGRTRLVRRAAKGYQKTDVRNALNAIIEDHEVCVNLWGQAQKMLPTIGTSMTKEVAQSALGHLQPAFEILNSVDLKIADAVTKAELIRIASQQPIDEASRLSSLYVKVNKYISAMQESDGYVKNYFENCQAAFLAVVREDYNEYQVKLNLVNYYNRKEIDCQDLLNRRISEVEEAANTLFN